MHSPSVRPMLGMHASSICTRHGTATRACAAALRLAGAQLALIVAPLNLWSGKKCLRGKWDQARAETVVRAMHGRCWRRWLHLDEQCSG